MTVFRRLAWLGLGLAYVHTVFGAIVRISGSGLGCGEHWPDCNGALVPTVTNYTVAVEVTHRYLAAMLLATSIALALLAVARRHAPGVGGRRGVLGPSLLAVGLIVTAALVGMVVVRLSLSNPYLIAVHYSIAMVTLATFVVAVQRADGLGATATIAGSSTDRTYRSARVAALLAFTTVVMGALTADVPGAATSCQGFPACAKGVLVSGMPLQLHLTHRALAFLLFFHLCGASIAAARRGERGPAIQAGRVAVAVVVLQVVVAASLVELRLPPVLQSLHQAVGTLLWVTVFTYAALARRAGLPSLAEPPGAVVPRGVTA
jgi:cytochrome c oxidase assembly protein subunit 15